MRFGEEDARAQATVEALGLNREALVEFRFDHLAPFRLLRQALPLLPADSEEAQDILALFRSAVLPGAQYSSMVRALLAEPALIRQKLRQPSAAAGVTRRW